MTHEEYKQLDELDQFEALTDYGKHVGSRKDETFEFLLYKIDDLYVELKTNMKLEVIQGSRSFDAGSNNLGEYLN